MVAAGGVSLGVACVVLLAGAGSALACVVDTDGDCFRPNYHVQRTDGSLAAWTGPGVGHIAYWLGGNGTPVEVVCETTGPREDGQPYVVWDQLDDGAYVYGYYLDTPGDGIAPALTNCPGSPGKVPPAPTSVKAVPISSTMIHVQLARQLLRHRRATNTETAAPHRLRTSDQAPRAMTGRWPPAATHV